ncbi:hypothetical protein [Methylocystis echinoides]|uniref:hypothetical protein n=1 Tax=Methylocystis echinoides TaxID=29468 RepID=UPI00342A1AC0
MAKTTKAPARKRRPPACNPARTSAQAARTSVDPVGILEEIAGNKRLKPTPRVAAARELLRYRLALAAIKAAPKVEERGSNKDIDRLTDDINRRALELLNARGNA